MPSVLQQNRCWDAAAHRFWFARVFNVHHSTRRPHRAPVGAGLDPRARRRLPVQGDAAFAFAARAAVRGDGPGGDGDGSSEGDGPGRWWWRRQGGDRQDLRSS